MSNFRQPTIQEALFISPTFSGNPTVVPAKIESSAPAAFTPNSTATFSDIKTNNFKPSGFIFKNKYLIIGGSIILIAAFIYVAHKRRQKKINKDQ